MFAASVACKAESCRSYSITQITFVLHISMSDIHVLAQTSGVFKAALTNIALQPYLDMNLDLVHDDASSGVPCIHIYHRDTTRLVS